MSCGLAIIILRAKIGGGYPTYQQGQGGYGNQDYQPRGYPYQRSNLPAQYQYGGPQSQMFSNPPNNLLAQNWNQGYELSRINSNNIQLRLIGFSPRNDDPSFINLTRVFQKFIAKLPYGTFFPIKIDRIKRWNGPNEYYVSSVMHGNSMLFGSRVSNRSRSIGQHQRIFDPKLQQQLDLDRTWISKIIIAPAGKPGQYIVQKFGIGHAIYRGVTGPSKV